MMLLPIEKNTFEDTEAVFIYVAIDEEEKKLGIELTNS